jgi:lysophospholipase L1-like esterase
MKKGDYLFIQFAHNDMKAGSVEATGFKETLQRFIDQTREKGGVPVLVTAMERRGGVNAPTLNGYPEAMRELAKADNVALIDLNAMSVELYKAFPADELPKLFAEASPGKYDGTHHGNFGSYELSKCVVMGIMKAGLPLASEISDDFKDFDPAHPDSLAAFDLPASPGFSTLRPLGD